MLGFFSESYPVDPRLSRIYLDLQLKKKQQQLFFLFFVGINKTGNFSLFPFFFTIVSKNFINLQVKFKLTIMWPAH